MSVDTSSSGMLALIKIVIGSPSLMGNSISEISSPFSIAFIVKILSKLNFQLLGKGCTLVLIFIIWNYLRCPSSKQSMSQAIRVSCLKEDANMGYLQKFILFLSILRHSLVWKRVNELLFGKPFYLLLSFIKELLSFKLNLSYIALCCERRAILCGFDSQS